MFTFYPQEGAKYRFNYERLAHELNKAQESNDFSGAMKKIRAMSQEDLFFLMYFTLGIVDVNHPWLVARINEVNDNRHKTLDVWARYHYKAVDVDEPVPTPEGFRKHGDLNPGDSVFGPDGTPRKVIAKTPVFTDADCYRVTFDKGYSVVVSGDHLWTVDIHSRVRVDGNKREKRRTITINTRELLEQHKLSEKYVTRIRPSVRLCKPLQFKQRYLPIHPYLLGAWLGDGYSAAGCISNHTMDDAIIQRISDLGYTTARQKGYRVSIYNILGVLKSIEVYRNKHIPDDYLFSCVDDRTELLRGLMDTDGCCDERGTATFCNKNENLSRQVFFLAASLGLKPSLRKHWQTVNGEPYPWYNVSFQAHANGLSAFHLERKKNRASDSPAGRSSRHAIVNVEPVPSRPVSCIQIDGEDGLYLIGNHCVTTHNSTCITVAGTIQDVIRDPLHRICIFSHTKSIAKDFLRRIKTIMETNGLLKTAFADIVPQNPVNQKGWMWSLDDGLQMKDGNNMGGSIMASGLVDSMPTGKHFTRRIYDDVVTRDSVATLEQRRKVSECVRLSHALGDPYKGTHCFIGTRYHWGDFYGELIASKEYTVREYACTHNGEYPAKPETATDEVQPMGDGISIMYPHDHIWNEFKLMGPDTFAAQMLLNPIKADERGFNVEWLKYYDQRPHTRNFVFVDPAGEKKEDSDYTVMWVVGIDTRGYYYILDCIRDRLNLKEKQEKLFHLVEKWKVLRVYYEKYSIQGDIEYIKEKQTAEGCHFAIEPVGGTRLTKEERILKLQPLFQEGKIIFPQAIMYTDVKGKRHNLVEDFITEEYNEFPVSQYRDMLDALARIRDEKVRISGPAYVEPPIEQIKHPLRIEAEYNDYGWLNQ